MDERSKQRIKVHLLSADVQERIQRSMEKGHAEATVTISRAAELFHLSENRLRDWEEYGLLAPLRPTGPKGRRLYTPAELDKLAIIRELIDAGYAPSDIPPDIDRIWHALIAQDEPRVAAERHMQPFVGVGRSEYALPVNQRINEERTHLFWRYYVSRALRLSLLLICEDIPHTTACLVLPLACPTPPENIRHVDDLAKVGPSLIGWLSQSRSSHTLLTSAPTFSYATDYRLLPLTVMTEDRLEEPPTDSIFLLLDRRSRRLTLSAPVLQTIRCLLRPLYENPQLSFDCFGPGTHDVLDPSPDLDNLTHTEDLILNGLMDMVVHLGGRSGEDHEARARWHSCCLLLPNYPTSVLSLQQRGLVVRAQSEHSPYKTGVTTVLPQDTPAAPAIRAFQSGHIIYLPKLSVEISGVTLRHATRLIRSCIAVPVDGSDGISSAVLYVDAETPDAFSEEDQRVLRLVGCMVGELLETYAARLHPPGKLSDIITMPGVVDSHFRDFLSENEFAEHVEALLAEVLTRQEHELSDVVSFISLDIDNQSSLANKYGDRMARDLSKAVGLRILSQLRALKDYAECDLYRINADRFYILLKGMSLEQAQAKAELLSKILRGSYQIDPQRMPAGQPTLPENMVTLSNITARLGVSSYFYWKLKQILQRYAVDKAVVESRILLVRFLDELLDIGKREGGNVVVSWDPNSRTFIHVPRPE